MHNGTIDGARHGAALAVLCGGLLACAALVSGCAQGEEPGIMAGYDDFVCLDGTRYKSTRPLAGGEVDRSSAYARTRAQLQDGDTVRPGGRFRDGDAGQLEPGTPLYRVEGRDPGSALAARFDGRWRVYAAGEGNCGPHRGTP